ncbi:MAG: ABC transporter substrate-binding protein, partial [Beijerinckiaceae bacterium]
AGAATAEPVNNKIHYSVAPAHHTPQIPHAPPGVYKQYGKSYVVSPQRMKGSGPALQAIAAGEIELGGVSPESLALGVKQANLKLVAIGQLMSGGVPGYGATPFYVRKGAAKTFTDLKGKVLAVNAFGSSIDAAIIAMAKKNNMVRGKDFQVVEVRFPAMMGALEKGRIDLAPLLTPFNLMADKRGTMEVLFDMRDALGPNETLIYVGQTDWVKKNRAALVDFLEDNIRLRKWLYDPKNREAAAELVAKVTKRPAKNYVSWVFSKQDNYRHPDALIDVPRLQKNLNDLNEIGVLKVKIDAANYVDLSLAKEAAARVK